MSLVVGSRTNAEKLDFSGLLPVQFWKISCETVLGRALGTRAGNPCSFDIDMEGNIDGQQLEILAQSISYKHDIESALKTQMQLRVHVNSNGGRVTTAMRMGRLIRREGGTVIAAKDCFSACVFLLIGGVEREVTGRIGIHRLFLDTDTKDMTTLPDSLQIKEAIDKLVTQAVEYVTEMNVPDRIVEDMMAVPSDSIKMLTIDDLLRYGIPPVDPYELEAREITEAKTMGISHAEYLERKNLVRLRCYPNRGDNPYLQTPLDKFDECYRQIMIQSH